MLMFCLIYTVFVSWNVRVVVIIPSLVFSGRAFVIIEWCLLGCRNASYVWLSAGIGIVRWLVWSSVAVWMSVMCLIFFLFEGTDILVVLSHVNKLAVLCCAHNNFIHVSELDEGGLGLKIWIGKETIFPQFTA